MSYGKLPGALSNLKKQKAFMRNTYAELLQQIHDDLRIQHPEWVQPNGDSPMCDFYETRLMDLLDTSKRNESDRSIDLPVAP